MTKWRLFIGGVGLRLMFLTPRDGMGNHQSHGNWSRRFS